MPNTPSKLDPLLLEFADVFKIPKCLPPRRSYDHKIPLKEGIQPINIRPYRHPSTQKDAIESMVEELLESVCSDDIMVYIPDMDSHVEHLRQILTVMRQQQLYAKCSKCIFKAPQVEYLAHIITNQGATTDPHKVQALVDWLVPTTLKQLRGFLGLTGYYRRFVKNYASISMPLTALFKKNSFGWNGEAQTAFETLKCAMIQVLSLQLLRLMHMELELPQVFVRPENHQSCTNKMVSKAHGFDYDIMYKKGAENVVAYALLRINGQAETLQIGVTTLSSELYDKVKQVWQDDTDLKSRIEKLQSNSASSKYYSWSAGQFLRKGKLRFKLELVPYLGLLQPLPILEKVWIEISMDFIDGLTMSKAAQSFLVIVNKLHGLPKFIVSDKDAVIMSRFWKELFSLLQVKLHTSTAYHPQSDGHTEVTTTYQVVYGQPPPPHITYTKGDGLVDVVDRYLSAREVAIDLMKFHIKSQLPQVSSDGMISKELYTVLDKRMTRKGNVVGVYVLIQWVNGALVDATWESYESIVERFPHFNLDA
nr:hypothetical protein [Tanacetum cinerariifolium]